MKYKLATPPTPRHSDTHAHIVGLLSLIICKPDCQLKIFPLKLSRETLVDLQREGSDYDYMLEDNRGLYRKDQP